MPNLTLLSLLLLSACAPEADPGEVPEPLVLPDDPAATGVPVGVRTVELSGGLTVEVWYPASDALAGEPGEVADIQQFVPASVTAVLGEIPFPPVPTIAIRDAALRVLEEPLPVVVFSHGFGGFRLQSVDYTTHLASRGYLVVSADHEGRMLGNVLPCVFSPPLEGCGLETEDPGLDDVPDLLDWLEDEQVQAGGWLAGRLDLDHIGLSGHSAGGGTTASVGNEDSRIAAMLPMASGGTLSREVPRLVMGGTCDAFADGEALEASWEASPGSALVTLEGAGHLAFSDLCLLELGTLSAELLEPREDVSAVFLAQLLSLATDGCPDGEAPGWEDCPTEYQDLDLSQTLVRHYSTVFFDAALRDSGEGVVDAGLAGARVEAAP